MNDLSNSHCAPVGPDAPRLNEREINQFLEKRPGWRTFEQTGELRLEKVFKFKDFTQAIAFTNQVAQAANKEDHHPAILTEWGKVTVTWWTHTIKGLHQNDVIMAAKTDQIFAGSDR